MPLISPLMPVPQADTVYTQPSLNVFCKTCWRPDLTILTC